ncbi:MAG: UDP-N-acetylmuramate--L-alanine ligase [Candidatus Omnitrophota bacterium]|nr:MAG: UDP-N-acetylmuramate--L-alanine ligase [Candidatus Omnitrophota bacterium]
MRKEHYHLIGIGGIGMSAIAKLLMRKGIKVSGSDIKENTIIQQLKEKGAQTNIGHSANNIKGADLIIYSSAIKQDNPELKEAQRLKIPLIRRAEALAKLMQDKTVITVTGSHGKTTTSCLASCLLFNAGFRPTIAVGGLLQNLDTNACLGEGDFFIAEADESDGSFLCYHPEYSIITNIDFEHLDYYSTFENMTASFAKFIDQTDRKGCIFAYKSDYNLMRLLKGYKYKYITFGLKTDADIYPKNINLKFPNSEFDCFYKNKYVAGFSLGLAGEHNILNSLSVIALGLELGINTTKIAQTLEGYKGTLRRMQIKFNKKKYMVIDDYAHHPTEIKATLSAIKNLEAGRMIVVFQAHRYSRTKLLIDEFGKCFDLADYIIITDIYPAGELPIKGIDAELIFNRLKENYPDKKIVLLPRGKIVAHTLENIRQRDIVVTIGAGDIGKTCDELVQELKRKN